MKLMDCCQQQGIETSIYQCPSGEATVDMVNEGVILAENIQPHIIVGMGGSVLDTGMAQ